MNGSTERFYVTGGTLQYDAPSYVERKADADLYEGLCRGEFCYVLTSRQMGKSSLMVRTAARLRAAGVTVVVLDLTAVGQNLTVEQWYDGLLASLGMPLDLEEDLEDFWLDNARLGPWQRWMESIRQVILPRCPDRLVIFVDEIDVVRSLPFSTDEFFAGIREGYNRRTQDPQMQRLTFCLLGVATPADLIRDTRMTPFNIGRRIELTDFTEAEAAPLAAGLNRPSASGRRAAYGLTLLKRVLFWTGGHPYLTQRLCQAVAEAPNVTTSEGVDSLCHRLFLSRRAREQDDNLLFVRERLLRSEAPVSHLLNLYAQIRNARNVVPDDETNMLVSWLRLSGIVRVAEGRLIVRNRIYARVFDRDWVMENMPDVVLRRQRAIAREEARKRRLAEEREIAARRLLYAADMNLAQQAWEAGKIAYALELLEAHRPQPDQEDLRGFEWRYLWRLCQDQSRHTFRGHEGLVHCAAFSPDGTLLATGAEDTTVKLWEVATRCAVAVLKGHAERIGCLAFSPDGKLLATGSWDKTIKLWNVGARQERAALTGAKENMNRLLFSPDGKLLIAACGGKTIRIWDVPRGQLRTTLRGTNTAFHTAAISPDGKTLAVGKDMTVVLWDIAQKRETTTFWTHGRLIEFSPDGRTLAIVDEDNALALWDVAAKHRFFTLPGHRDRIQAIAFSQDGRTLASSSSDCTIKLWDVLSGKEKATLKGHCNEVYTVAFSPDDTVLLSSSKDGTAKLWDSAPPQEMETLRGHLSAALCLAFSPDGTLLATGSMDTTARLWDVHTTREIAMLAGHKHNICCVAFSPDGATLLTGSQDRTLKLWELPELRERAVLKRNLQMVTAAAFSPDGKTLAVASGLWDHPGVPGAVALWDREKQKEIAVLQGHTGLVLCLAFSRDGTLLVTGGSDKTIRIWDMAARKEAAPPLRGFGDWVSALAFAPNGKTLAVGSQYGTVTVWEVGAWRERKTLNAHTGTVGGVAFSPDGKTLATGGQDRAVNLWNTATWRLMQTLQGHTAGVSDLAFSPDGNTLASASSDGTARLWRAASFAATDSARPTTKPHSKTRVSNHPLR